MDNLSSTLISQLVEKALENTPPDERLSFIEKLFTQLPPEAQQEFLLNFTRLTLGSSAQTSLQPTPADGDSSKPMLIQLIPAKLEDFAPGQICCQALTGLAEEDGMDEQHVVNVAQMFSGLADETRIKIVKLLAKGEFTVDELVEFMGTPQSTTSHHLRVLKEANLIRGEKRGRNTYYSLVQPEVAIVETG
ncbi:MAG TPA: metalloregulator ArsR/SmtB family transcription factor [Anaerolineales bacterium]|nr:metalloregulator ArsR/SmtB family transcription factor [Anaerolineales bacterium]